MRNAECGLESGEWRLENGRWMLVRLCGFVTQLVLPCL